MSGPLKSSVAAGTPYDNIPSGIPADNVQDAIDYLLTGTGRLGFKCQAFAPGVTTDKWLMVDHPTTPSLYVPFVIPMPGNVVALTYSNQNNSSECDLEFYVNGSLVHTWQIRNRRLAWKVVGAGIFSFTQGQRLSIFLRRVSGTDAKDPIVTVYGAGGVTADANSGIENGV